VPPPCLGGLAAIPRGGHSDNSPYIEIEDISGLLPP
jgi:hypothetical protein